MNVLFAKDRTFIKAILAGVGACDKTQTTAASGVMDTYTHHRKQTGHDRIQETSRGAMEQ